MQQPSLFNLVAHILAHVPLFVWAILAFIIVMGRRQSRTSAMSRKRLLVLPLIWLVFGAWGVQQGFGGSANAAMAEAAWAVGLIAGIALMVASRWPGQARFDAATGHFIVPGSWLPMAMMLSIFVAKFAVGMSLGMQPALAQHAGFALTASAAFGAFSGFFVGRSINILRRGQAVAPAPVASSI